MFGANPIPETELSTLNGTNVTADLKVIDVSHSRRINQNKSSEGNYMKYSSSYNIISTTISSFTGDLNFSVVTNTYPEVGSSISTSQNEFICQFYNPEYIIYSSLCSFFIPCVFMVFLYSRIFWVSFFFSSINKIIITYN